MNKPNYQKLQAQITQLRSEKELLRLYLHELVESFYKVVNGGSQKAKQTTNSRTFNSDLENLFKGFSQIIKSCPNCSNKVDNQTGDKFKTFFGSANPNECNWEQMPDIFSKMKGEKDE